jgi:hypothetical protein
MPQTINGLSSKSNLSLFLCALLILINKAPEMFLLPLLSSQIKHDFYENY